jgi:hypothetical protein
MYDLAEEIKEYSDCGLAGCVTVWSCPLMLALWHNAAPTSRYSPKYVCMYHLPKRWSDCTLS